MFNANDAYAEGYCDARNHVPLEMNPFAPGSVEHEAYEHGWEEARYEFGIRQFFDAEYTVEDKVYA